MCGSMAVVLPNYRVCGVQRVTPSQPSTIALGYISLYDLEMKDEVQVDRSVPPVPVIWPMAPPGARLP